MTEPTDEQRAAARAWLCRELSPEELRTPAEESFEQDRESLASLLAEREAAAYERGYQDAAQGAFASQQAAVQRARADTLAEAEAKHVTATEVT